jgi:hypothetical protein
MCRHETLEKVIVGRTWMSGNELQLGEILSRVKAGDLTQVEAAQLIRRS